MIPFPDTGLLWNGLAWPLLRLTAYISIGLFVGNLIEALNWTQLMGKVAAPLARIGRLRDISGASFATAFFSGVSANTILAEAYEQKKLSTKELIFSNLFNSLPTYFLHLPTILMIAVPFIGSAALLYVGLTAFAALLRTVFIILLGHLLLPPIPEGCVPCLLEKSSTSNKFQAALSKTWKRFKKRLPKILKITVPVYIVFFFFKQYGVFDWLEHTVAGQVNVLTWLPPQAISIVIFHLSSEITAGLAAAGSLLGDGQLHVQQIVLALLLGNILSSPMRAIRHQFPYYAGIFRPKLAITLIACNQSLRAMSLIVVGIGYILLSE